MSIEPKQSPVLPIFASTDAGANVYRTLGDFLGDAEPVDIENGEWTAFDAVGYELNLSVEEGLVTIRVASVAEPGRLAEWLRGSLSLLRRSDEQWLRNATLPDLVTAYVEEDDKWRETLVSTRIRRWLSKLVAR